MLVECPWKAARRPYHKQKLALVLANLRHFALEQAERGVAVEHRVAKGPYGSALRAIAREKGGLRCMRPAELELRRDLSPLESEGLIEWVPHEGWLTTPEQFAASQKSAPPWRMDAFYRQVRRAGGWLMDAAGKPLGGKFSFDAENREAWKGDPAAARPPEFSPHAVTEEVAELVTERFSQHPGEVQLASLPATRRQASALWSWAKRECLPRFGPFEDAMSTALAHPLSHARLGPGAPAPPASPQAGRGDLRTRHRAPQQGGIRQAAARLARVHAPRARADGRLSTHPGAGLGCHRERRGQPRGWRGESLLSRRTRAPSVRLLGESFGHELSGRGRAFGLGGSLFPPHHAPDGAVQHRHAAGRVAPAS